MTDRLTSERKAQIEAKLQAAAPGCWEPQAIHELLTEVEHLQGEIGAVDQVLARRLALDGIPDRVDKIIHALNTAGKAEPKR